MKFEILIPLLAACIVLIADCASGCNLKPTIHLAARFNPSSQTGDGKTTSSQRQKPVKGSGNKPGSQDKPSGAATENSDAPNQQAKNPGSKNNQTSLGNPAQQTTSKQSDTTSGSKGKTSKQAGQQNSNQTAYGSKKKREILLEVAREHEESGETEKAIETFEKALLLSKSDDEYKAVLEELHNVRTPWRIFGVDLVSLFWDVVKLCAIGFVAIFLIWAVFSIWKKVKNWRGILIVDLKRNKASKDSFDAFVEHFQFARYQLEEQSSVIKAIECSRGNSSVPNFVLANSSTPVNLIDEFGDAWWTRLIKSLVRSMNLLPANYLVEVSIVPLGDDFSLGCGLRKQKQDIGRWKLECTKADLSSHLHQVAFAVASQIQNEGLSSK